MIRPWFCTAVLCWTALGVQAASPAAERDRIDAERAASAAQLADQERGCEARFIVAACLARARSEHRATLARLRREDIRLDETRRRELAAGRRQAILHKAAVQEARASDAAPSIRSRSVREGATLKPPEPGRAGNSASTLRPTHPASADEQRAAELRSKARFDARASAADKHRDSVERRNAQRAAQGRMAASLPEPRGASGP